MTKTKAKSAAIPRYMWDWGLANDATVLAVWQAMADEDLPAVKRRAILLVGEHNSLHKVKEQYRQELAEVRRLRKEESEFYQRELAAAKQANLGRIQSNLLQTLQSMMATMEGNSRAVHALAVPVGDLLEQLGKELREGKGQQK